MESFPGNFYRGVDGNSNGETSGWEPATCFFHVMEATICNTCTIKTIQLGRYGREAGVRQRHVTAKFFRFGLLISLC